MDCSGPYQPRIDDRTEVPQAVIHCCDLATVLGMGDLSQEQGRGELGHGVLEQRISKRLGQVEISCSDSMRALNDNTQCLSRCIGTCHRQNISDSVAGVHTYCQTSASDLTEALPHASANPGLRLTAKPHEESRAFKGGHGLSRGLHCGGYDHDDTADDDGYLTTPVIRHIGHDRQRRDRSDRVHGSKET